MKRVAAILIAALSLWLCGCVIGNKRQVAKATPPAPQPAAPLAPQAPPAPLSIPQTQVELPAPQPVDPAALATAPPEAPPETPSKARPPRRAAPPVRSSVEAPAAAAPPPAETATEPERPPIQEILPAETQKKFQESAESHKRDVTQLLQQAQSRRLTRQQAGLVKRIEQFVKLSDGAEQSGNMREADEFAERALVLARELTSAR